MNKQKYVIGKEYTEEKIDFLTNTPFVIKKLTYMGRSPYDDRHIFASSNGGTILVSDNAMIEDKLV